MKTCHGAKVFDDYNLFCVTIGSWIIDDYRITAPSYSNAWTTLFGFGRMVYINLPGFKGLFSNIETIDDQNI